MEGLRGFLIGFANLVLAVLVFGVPLVAFFVTGNAMGWRGEFNIGAGIGAGLLAFLTALPLAAMLALFLDIREQLVRLNRSLGGTNSPERPVEPKNTAIQSHAVPPPGNAATTIEAEIQQWFKRTYGHDLTVDEAREIIAARAAGRPVEVNEAILARKRGA